MLGRLPVKASLRNVVQLVERVTLGPDARKAVLVATPLTHHPIVNSPGSSVVTEIESLT